MERVQSHSLYLVMHEYALNMMGPEHDKKSPFARTQTEPLIWSPTAIRSTRLLLTQMHANCNTIHNHMLFCVTPNRIPCAPKLCQLKGLRKKFQKKNVIKTDVVNSGEHEHRPVEISAVPCCNHCTLYPTIIFHTAIHFIHRSCRTLEQKDLGMDSFDLHAKNKKNV